MTSNDVRFLSDSALRSRAARYTGARRMAVIAEIERREAGDRWAPNAAPFVLSPAERSSVVADMARLMIASAGVRVPAGNVAKILERATGGRPGFPPAAQLESLHAAAAQRYRETMAQFAAGVVEIC